MDGSNHFFWKNAFKPGWAPEDFLPVTGGFFGFAAPPSFSAPFADAVDCRGFFCPPSTLGCFVCLGLSSSSSPPLVDAFLLVVDGRGFGAFGAVAAPSDSSSVSFPDAFDLGLGLGLGFAFLSDFLGSLSASEA